MPNNFSLEKTLRRIDEKLSQIAINTHKMANDKKILDVPIKNTETWVTVGVIQTLTGWKKEQLRQARKNNLVNIKREGVSVLYNLESLNKKFIIFR